MMDIAGTTEEFSFKYENKPDDYFFLGWSKDSPATKQGDIVSTANSATISISSSFFLYKKQVNDPAPSNISFNEDYKQWVYANFSRLKVQSADENQGTAVLLGAFRALDGDNVRLKATAKTGYEFVGWKKDDDENYVSYDNPFSFTVSNTVGNTTVGTYTACFQESTTEVPQAHNVIKDACVHGSLLASHESATENTTITLTVAPDAGYEVSTVRYDNTDATKGDDTHYSFTMPNDVVIVSATFVISKPTDLAVSNIGQTSATLSWSAGVEGKTWQVCLNGDETHLLNATSNSLTIQNLIPSSFYTAKVRACFSETDYSEWSSEIRFSTACGAIPSSALPWSENFDIYTAGSTSASSPTSYPNDELPLCWDFLNRSETSGSYPQVFISSHSNYAVSGNCLFFNSSDVTPLYAVLPQFADPIANLQLNFTYRNEGVNSSDGTLIVGYMTDPADAATFTPIYTCEKTFILTKEDVVFTGAPTGSYIAFKYQGYLATNSHLSIDDVSVGVAPSCPRPKNLAVAANSITAHGATVTWEEYGSATTWMVEYADNAEFSQAVSKTVNNTPTYTFQGLDDETTYYVRVKAHCGEGDESEYSNVVSFTTPVACPAPTALVASNITGHTAQLDWTGYSDSYTVLYRTKAYVINPVLSEEFNTSSIPTGWERFQGLVDDVVNGGSTTESSSSWSTSSYALGVYNAKLNIYGTSRNDWFVTPEVTLPSSGAALNFDLALTKSGSEDAATGTCADDRFVVLIYADSKWTILREWNNSSSDYVYNNIAITGENVNIDLSTYNGKTVKLAFYGESTEGGNGDNDLHIDNVAIGTPVAAGAWQTANTNKTTANLDGLVAETIYEVKVQGDCGSEGKSRESAPLFFTTDVACPAPTDLVASNITGHTAQLDWTGYSDSYTVLYRTKAYVINPVLSEEFNTSSIPTGWERFQGLVDDVVNGGSTTESSSSWSTSSYALGVYNAKLNIYGTSRNDWFVTPEVTLPSSGAALNFDLALTKSGSEDAATGTCADDRFVVLIYADSKWTILREWNNSSSDYVYNNIAITGENVNIDLSTYNGKTVKLAFYGESTEGGNGDNDLHIDNVAIGTPVAAGDWQTANTDKTTANLDGLVAKTVYEVKVQGDCGSDGKSKESAPFFFTTDVACPAPTSLYTSNPKKTSIDLTWTSYADAWQICVNSDEDHLISISNDDATVDGTTISYKLTGLTAANEYTVKVRSNCGSDGYSLWSDEESFTTLEDCAKPTEVDASNISHDAADITWTGDSESFTVSYRTAEQIDGLSEEFNSFPADWTFYSGVLNADGTATLTSSYDWSIGTSNNVFDDHAYMDLYSTMDGWLVTPSLSIAAGDGLRFDVAYTAYLGNHPAPVTDCTTHRFVVLISTDNMSHWTILREWNNSGSTYVLDDISPNGQSVNIDLSTYAGQTVNIAFYGHSETDDYDNNIHIDNVSIGVPVAVGDWKTVTATGGATTARLSGLTPNFKYDVKVIPSCNAENESDMMTFTTLGLLELADNADNSTALINNNYRELSVKLQGRTLWKDGDWNTLCLPFDMTAAQVTEQLNPTALKELDNAGGTYAHVTGLDGSKLYLNFKDAAEISAGVPYIIKWSESDPNYSENPVFAAVFIPYTYTSAKAIADALADAAVTFTGGKFVGTYSYKQYTEENKSILFLGENNTLYYPQPDLTGDTPVYPAIGAFRAYFQMDDPVAVRSFVLNFGDDSEVTGIIDVQPVLNSQSSILNSNSPWYTIDGRKLSRKPVQRGVYIQNGRQIVMKESKEIDI